MIKRKQLIGLGMCLGISLMATFGVLTASCGSPVEVTVEVVQTVEVEVPVDVPVIVEVPRIEERLVPVTVEVPVTKIVESIIEKEVIETVIVEVEVLKEVTVESLETVVVTVVMEREVIVEVTATPTLEQISTPMSTLPPDNSDDGQIKTEPTPKPIPTPTPTPPTLEFIALASGHSYTCAIRADDAMIVCQGEAGNPNAANAAIGTAIEIDANKFEYSHAHTCAIFSDGSVNCWGKDDYGKSSAPEGRFTQVSLGSHHSCALRDDGAAMCWGSNSNRQSSPPTDIRFSYVASGWLHTCGIRHDDQSAVCWGRNNHGESDPPSGKFTRLALGHSYTCGITIANEVLCWGSPPEKSIPQDVYVDVSAGEYYVCVLNVEGTAACFGDDEFGKSSPPSDLALSTIDLGKDHACGLTQDRGEVVCWGKNQWHQIEQ